MGLELQNLLVMWTALVLELQNLLVMWMALGLELQNLKIKRWVGLEIAIQIMQQKETKKCRKHKGKDLCVCWVPCKVQRLAACD